MRNRHLRDLAQDIRGHIEEETLDNIARGMTPDEARRAALHKFGNVTRVQEDTRAEWIWPPLEQFVQDLRYGLRTLLKHRSFSLVTVLTLALGIGASTAIFSLVNAVLLRSLPYGEPERLVYLYSRNAHFAVPSFFAPGTADFFDLKKQSKSFAKMTLFEQATYNAATDDRTDRIGAAKVEQDFFATLQCAPEFGRVFSARDEHVAVISHALWQGMFGGRADILGRTVRLDEKAYQVVGVMPAGFGFPHKSDITYGDGHIETTQLWLPLTLTAEERADRENFPGVVLARLKPGVPLREAQAETTAMMSRLDLLHSAGRRGWGALVEPFLDTALGPVRPLMWLLSGAVAFVLLITCANAASLLLARARNRAYELGVRATLGAGRVRLLRQMLTESLLLSAVAGLVGVGLAYFFLHALLKLNPGDIPRMQDATLDIPVMAFLVAVTTLTGILFGIFPAVTATRIHFEKILKNAGMRGIIGDRKRMRSGLVIAQVALVVVLLTGAGLLLRSYINVFSVPTGFSGSTITVNVQLSAEWYVEKMEPRYNSVQKQQTFFRELLGKLRSIHGIEAAGAIDFLPLSNSEGLTLLEIPGHANDKNEPIEIRRITADYLSAAQVPLVKGRNITDEDTAARPLVALVNEAFVRKYFHGGDAIGRRFRPNPRLPWITIAGVTGDVRNMSLEAAAPAQIYTSFWQTHDGAPVSSAYVAIRSSLPQSAVVSNIRAAVRSLDPNLAIADIHAMGDLVTQATARRRFQATLLTVFSGIALLLAVVGVYGLLAYSVSQRTGEIGIRMALGSPKIRVVRLILREGIGLLGMGLLLGLAGALAFARLLSSFLFDVPALDPITFTLAPALLFAAAFAACLIPSYRASGIDPMNALRHE